MYHFHQQEALLLSQRKIKTIKKRNYWPTAPFFLAPKTDGFPERVFCTHCFQFFSFISLLELTPHCIETALSKAAVPTLQFTVPIWPDISASFDPVLYSLMPEIHSSLGFQDTTLSWIFSYLFSYSSKVSFSDVSSSARSVNVGVSCGAVLALL